MAMSIIALLLLKLYAAISVSPKSQVVAAHAVLSNSWRHTPQQVTEINSLHFASQAVAVEVAAKKPSLCVHASQSFHGDAQNIVELS